MEFLQQVAARLYEIRKEMKINQQQMGEIMGVSRASYSLYENGKLPIDVLMLNKLHEKTGYSFDYLLGCSEIKHNPWPPQLDIEVMEKNVPPVKEGYNRIVFTDEMLHMDLDELAKLIHEIVDNELDDRGV